MALFALKNVAEWNQWINDTGLWFVLVMLVIGPGLVGIAMLVVLRILDLLRDHFHLVRDDRTEGSYLVEASLVVASVAIIIASVCYIVWVLRQAGP